MGMVSPSTKEDTETQRESKSLASVSVVLHKCYAPDRPVWPDGKWQTRAGKQRGKSFHRRKTWFLTALGHGRKPSHGSASHSGGRVGCV